MAYIKHIPHIMRDIKEYVVLGVAGDPEIEAADNVASSIENNHYLSSLDKDGCTRMETIIRLDDGSSLTLEQRRLAIISKANNTLPYTLYRLKSKLKIMLENDGFDLIMDYSNYHLIIILFIYNKDKFDYIVDGINDEIPCNIRLTIQLEYNSYNYFKIYTYNQLKAWTYKYMKEHNFSGG